MVVEWLLAGLVVGRGLLCAAALTTVRRQIPPLRPGQGPALSVIIPLHGWDERFLELLDTLGVASGRYGSPVEVIVVVDDDHPRLGDIRARGHVTTVAPSTPLRPGDADKVRRLRTGASCARHPFVMLVDSDVVIDEDFLLRRAAPHVADPQLRLSFALPSYAQARAIGDRVLGAFTLHYNLVIYFLGWWVLRRGTSIGPSQLFRNDDGVLPSMLEALSTSVADDHALGHAVEKRGERVMALPEQVIVHATDPSVGAAAAQIVRWMTAGKTAVSLLSPASASWISASSLLTSLGPILCVAGGASPHALMVGGGLMLTEGVILAALDMLLTGRGPRPSLIVATPAFILGTPLLVAVGLWKRDLLWRGRVQGPTRGSRTRAP